MSELSTMTLQFKISSQHIVRLDDNIVVEKSKNYLYAHFTFSDDWMGLDKYILVRPYDIDIPIKLELDNTNTCKIPYDVIVFPGFVISARGEDVFEEIVLIGDGIGVDVEIAKIENGSTDLPIREITSTGNTINISRLNETVNLDLEMGLIFNPNNSTLTLNAITHNEVDDQGQPITVVTPLAVANLNPSIENIVAEDSYTEGGITTYRNIVFTYTDGTTQRVSIDKFWNEIREQVNGLDIAINSLSNRVSAIEVDYLTSADKNELEGEISGLNNELDALEDVVNTKASQTDLNQEVQARQQADNNLSTRIGNLESEGFITQDINTSSIAVQYTKSKSKIALVSESEWESYYNPTNEVQLSCDYGNNYFISVGENGSVIYSQDGQNWLLFNQVFSQTDLNKIVYGNGYFLAISYESKIIYRAYTPNIWTIYNDDLGEIIPTNLEYVNNQFVLSGENGKLAYSNDGKKFKVISTGVNQTINSVAYGNAAYVAVGNNGLLLYSKEFVNWYNITDNNFIEDYKNIKFYNGIFIANTNQKVKYSTNYYQFFEATIPDLTFENYIIKGIEVGESNYYIIATNNSNSKILKSTNGKSFVLDQELNNTIYTIDYGMDNYVIIGANSLIYNLDLAITWSYDKPSLEEDEYLWGRSVNYLNNGDILYSAAYFIFTPKTLSEFQNDMGFIDSNVDDLENYYDKPTANNLLDEKQDDMININNNEIDNLFE